MNFITAKHRWERLLDDFPEANFLQSWNWGEFHQHLDHPVYRVRWTDGLFTAIVEKARRATYLTIPGGPLLKTYRRKSWQQALNLMKQIANRDKCSFIRLRPQMIDSPAQRAIMASLGLRPAPMHLHAQLTRVLDLTKSANELLAQMRKSTRHEIRRSHKLGIQVHQTTNERLVDEFITLQTETAQREHFIPFGRDYLLAQFRAFANDNLAAIFLISKSDVPAKVKLDFTYADTPINDIVRPIMAAIVSFYRQEAVYHYAAATSAARKFPAAYAMQWAIIQAAKTRGCHQYNLWGDVPDNKLTTHRFAGPSLFKRGFGGKQLAYLPAHDLPLNWKYWPNWTVETIRKKMRRL